MAKDQAPTTPPVINASPKARFMESGVRISSHRNVMQLDPLRTGIDWALLHYQHYLAVTGAKDANDAAQSMIKMKGALEFIDLLYKLAEPPSAAPQPITNVTKLDHSV